MKYKINEERLGEHDIPVLLQCIANESAEANRLKRLEIIWGSRAGNMTDRTLKNLMKTLQDTEDINLDIYGDFDD